ncbi:anillin-like [Phlebotomus argentipes]|uniref:anillin-like n=1 Tax=Phlebotomus argentipes TaxID=94469 RepID=UPI0028934203|nr:anillin-like [Phlebotomus argentipes]
MDPFTQRILDRAEQRSKQLGISNPVAKVPLGENSAESSLSSLGGSSKSPGRKVSSEKRGSDGKNVLTYMTNTTGGSDADKFDNISVEINITTDSNVGVKCDVTALDVDCDGNVLKTNELLNESTASIIRDASKSRLQRLGALYSAEHNISSPIHRTEGNFHEKMTEDAEPPRPRNRMGKLAALADSINRWEDQNSGVQKENVAIPKATGAVPKRPQVVDTLPKDVTKKTPTKQLKWDKSVMDALESQGFKKRESTKNLVYEYGENENRERENVLNETRKSSLKKSTIDANRNTDVKDSPKKLNVTRGLVTGRAALFEASGALSRPAKVASKDPAEMSLKERMALFEKNKGAAPVPRPVGVAPGPQPVLKPAEEEKKSRPNFGGYNQVQKAESKATGGGIKNTVAALMTSGATISENAISQETRRQRQQEMDILMNRFHQTPKSDSENEGISLTEPAQPPPPPPMPSTSFGSGGKRRSDGENDPDTSSDEVKRVKKHSLRKSDLYPNLAEQEFAEYEQNCTTATVSEEESNGQRRSKIFEEDESAMESEEADDSSMFEGSISRAVMNSIRSAESSRVFSVAQATDSSDEEVDEMDDYLDEALDNSMGSSKKNTPRKGSISSNSFSYKRNSPAKQLRFETPVSSKITVSPKKSQKDDEVVTLVHTVSFYRKQQSSKTTPPCKVIRRVETTEDSTTESEGYTDEPVGGSHEVYLVESKIERLKEEVQKQHQIIAQASGALNLCASTFEFSGSTEAVEAERHLLVATHRRQAAQDEIQRLKVEQTLRPRGSPQDHGKLTVKEITLPLRQDYIRKLASNTISGQHLICLLKYNETVMSTKTVITLPGLLAVKFSDELTMTDVYEDFKITLEIYGMDAQNDILPHDVKYHIAGSKKQASKKLTPKGRKGEKRLVMPIPQSPAGPGVVRRPTMEKLGFVIFSLKDTKRTSWTLNGATGASPLEGVVQMKVACQLDVTVDHKGFLNMFEDVVGLGAWQRRWCRLRGHMLNYWKYPDDEKSKKPPMGRIDLYSCCSERVEAVPRDVCARMNTLLLELKRPSRESDEESLVILKRGKSTIVRHLLSTDTKAERDEWKTSFNKALSLLRSWGPAAAE